MKRHLRNKRGLAALAAVAAVFAFAAPIASADFADVPPSNPFYNEINIFRQTNITSGCTATLFCPTDIVRRQAMAAFIDRSLGLVVRPGETALAPVPGSKIEQASRVDDGHGNTLRGSNAFNPPHLVAQAGAVDALTLNFGPFSANVVMGPSGTGYGVSGSAVGGHSTFATDDYGVVAGGDSNQVGNGLTSVTDAGVSVVAGGEDNVATEPIATVLGGAHNRAGNAGVAAGGNSNSGAVAGFAAGTNAKATNGSFVWGDLDYAHPFQPPTGNAFVVRARGGVYLGNNSSAPSFPAGHFIQTSTGAYLSSGGTWVNSSDRNRKSDFRSVDEASVLDRLAKLPVTSWSYKVNPKFRHIGPMAQDFAKAFRVGQDNRHIASVDADGVVLAAIQALERQNQSQRERIARLKHAIAAAKHQQ